ncbi:MAG: MFS transporter [Candidatus Tectimicrobiota bacterium]|nr:MAG: MFS transporter [Candidatus Tectomicrobia bacterium]
MSAPAATAAEPAFRYWRVAFVLMLGFTTAGLSVTVVNLAFPHIMTSLRADLDVMQWVQTGYMIVQAVMMPSVGWLGARLGNRRLYLLSLGTFVAGSVLCGMAWDVYSLIAFRLLQAVGVGPLFPITQVIMFQSFPEEKRGLAMGISSLGFSFGPMVGPVLAGYLLEHASWRTVFYINVPVGLLGLALAYLVLPPPRGQEGRRLDLAGMGSMAAFLVCFLLAMSQGRVEGWDSPYILTLLALAAVAGVAFVTVELRSVQPFVELRLYARLPFAMASLVVFLNTLSFMATNFVVALFLQSHLDYTPLQAAWMLMPSAVVIGALSVVVGRLSDFVAPKLLVIFGLALVGWSLIQYATITPLTSVGTITLLLTIRGFARAFTIAPLTTAALAALPESEVRMGSGLVSLTRGIASTGSVTLTAAFFQHRFHQRLELLVQEQAGLAFAPQELLQQLHAFFEQQGDFSQVAGVKALATLHRLLESEAALYSYHDTFIVLGAISLAAILPALWMGKRRPARRQAPAPAPAPAARPASR